MGLLPGPGEAHRRSTDSLSLGFFQNQARVTTNTPHILVPLLPGSPEADYAAPGGNKGYYGLIVLGGLKQ